MQRALIRGEETRSDSTSKESILRQPFLNIFFIHKFLFALQYISKKSRERSGPMGRVSDYFFFFLKKSSSLLQRISNSEAPRNGCGWDGASALLPPFRQDKTVHPSHRQRVSLWLGPDTDRGIDGQHIHPTDSEIVVTMFQHSKTWQFGCLFNRMSESAHLCPGEILKNAFTPQL